MSGADTWGTRVTRRLASTCRNHQAGSRWPQGWETSAPDRLVSTGQPRPSPGCPWPVPFDSGARCLAVPAVPLRCLVQVIDLEPGVGHELWDLTDCLPIVVLHFRL